MFCNVSNIIQVSIGVRNRPAFPLGSATRILRGRPIDSRAGRTIDRSQPEYLWVNTMENFKSNRIKIIFLLYIRLSEIGVTISIVFGITFWISSLITIGAEYEVKAWLQHPSNSFPDYCFLVRFPTFRFTNSITTTSLCSMAFFIRILTQYMIYQLPIQLLQISSEIEPQGIHFTHFFISIVYNCNSI